MSDLAVPLRWIEGHIAVLDHEAAGHEHAYTNAATESERAQWAAEHAAVLARQAQWREVVRLITASPLRRGTH